jgi:crossover junction endodeoxyribonuclease RuvC
MRIMGIDPGTVRMGYGLIDQEDEELTVLDYGALTVSSRISLPERLHRLYLGLTELASRYGPQEMAIEEPFVPSSTLSTSNARSALAIGRAEAVAMLVAAKNTIPVYSYQPARVKRMVANYGGSDKEQVQQVVCMQLGLAHVPEPSDAADALAVALCHIQERRLARLVADSS